MFDHAGDHAGELETSMMMYLFPDLVSPLEEAADGFAKQFRVKAMKEKKGLGSQTVDVRHRKHWGREPLPV